MTDINVEQIMQEIQREIEVKRCKNEPLTFNDVGDFYGLTINYEDGQSIIDELYKQLEDVNSQYRVLEDRFYPNNTFKDKIKLFFKKRVRNPIRFYINPIVTDQNEFNASVTRSLNEIQRYLKENQALRRHIRKLEIEILALKRNVKAGSPGEEED